MRSCCITWRPYKRPPDLHLAQIFATTGLFELSSAGDQWTEKAAYPIFYAPKLYDLISWAAGVASGRYTASRFEGTKPEDLLAAPGCRSPAMVDAADLTGGHNAETLVLVEDAGHPDDIVAQVASILATYDAGREMLDEESREWSLRSQFRTTFFRDHIERYSIARRKCPIYWQLATPSASYSIWLYIHAFTRDTLYKVQNEYVAQKLAHEERKLESLYREFGANPTSAQRKDLADQQFFVQELRAFLDEVKRVAPLWNPNLDDGVIINFAPLWRLVPHHKPWQKELKATWDALSAGEYDWAHLAMHLWPERVVPKCATDRSLAIAHGLEEVFWMKGEDGKWRPRPIPARPVDELVRERTSPAVKAALKSLLEAPVFPGSNGRGRPRRGRRTAA